MSAIDAFQAAVKETERLANVIVHLADRFPADPKDIHWGHVGDMEFVNARLREIVEHFA